MLTPTHVFSEDQPQNNYTDPVHFISNYCIVNTPTRGHILIDPTDKQIDLIGALHNQTNRTIIMDRQVGKTSISLAYLLWYLIHNPSSNCVFVSINQTNVDHASSIFTTMYNRLPDSIKLQLTTQTKSTIEFENGSRLHFQTATSVVKCGLRGMMLSLCILDEFFYCQHTVDILCELMPALYSNGSCKIVSSENPTNKSAISGFEPILL